MFEHCGLGIGFPSHASFLCARERERSELIKQLYLKGWQQWARVPVEVLVDPAQTNTAESVCAQLETDGARIITTAAEAHNQLGR